jgi:uncharacterized repeat protein (TIGR02543 family)
MTRWGGTAWRVKEALIKSHALAIGGKRSAPRVLLCAALAIALLLPTSPPWRSGSGGGESYAKTAESPKAETLFVYAKDINGMSVLVKSFTLDELKAMQHGPGGADDFTGTYKYSATDNFPVTVYSEGRGFTIPELVSKAARQSGAGDLSNVLSFSAPNDTIRLMATDSGGVNYARSHTYADLYEKHGYYYPGLFTAWSQSWEISGSGYTATSSIPMPLETYMADHKAEDKYYQAKATVSSGGIATMPILAVDKVSGRLSELQDDYRAIAGSWEQIVTGGSLTQKVGAEGSDIEALTLLLPQTPDVLFSGNRTMYHCFKWVYKVQLDMGNAPNTSYFASRGTVATPTATVTPDDAYDPKVLTIRLSSATEGASIYYTLNGRDAVKLYDDARPITVSAVSAGAPAAFDLYASAVKEGYDDTGSQLVASYPSAAPILSKPPTSVPDSSVTISGSGVSADVWADWAQKIQPTSKLERDGGAAAPVASGSGLTVSADPMSVTIDGGLMPDGGEYKLTINSAGYKQITLSFSVRRTPPAVAAVTAQFGERIDIPVTDAAYLAAVNSVSVRKDGTDVDYTIDAQYYATSGSRLSIAPSYYSYSVSPMKSAGRYIVTLAASGYSPDREIVVDLSQPPPDPTPPTTPPSSDIEPPQGTTQPSVGDTATKPAAKAKKFKLTFDPSKGKLKGQKYKTVTYGAKYGKLPTPTRKGYKFTGWYTKAGGGKKITANDKVAIKKNTKIYAHWKKR